MKTFLAIAIIILVSFCSITSAQNPTSKGVYRLSGSVGFYYSTSKFHLGKEENFTYYISPGYSFFPIDNLELGLQIAYYHSRFTLTSDFSNQEQTMDNQYFQIGPAVRYYFPLEKVIPFVGAQVSFASDASITLFKNLSFRSIIFTGGFDYFLSRNIALEPAVSYSYSDQGGTTTNQIIFAAGINYFIF